MRDRVLVVLAILLALILGVLLGQIIDVRRTPVPQTVLKEDTRPLVPVVEIMSGKEGHIEGTIKGNVRVFLGNQMIIPTASGSFRTPAWDLLKNLTAAPEGMNFVASRRGTKYYPVDSSVGQKLAAENRVYFKTSEEAEAAGYRP